MHTVQVFWVFLLAFSGNLLKDLAGNFRKEVSQKIDSGSLFARKWILKNNMVSLMQWCSPAMRG
ncbi:MAG: hypothetical protein HYX24_07595 [Candidatus Aenigmarchaeota archaeon]|nr:hypothetical protein [Candidatus Aenigmarchaeota archaeon]